MIEELKKIRHLLNISQIEAELDFYPSALQKALDGTQPLSRYLMPKLEKWYNEFFST